MKHASSHTPGPLRAVLETAHTSAEITDEKGRLIASFAVRPYRKRTNADARLFAASHLLLSALERLTHPAADDSDLANALDVIALARGAK